MNKVDFDRFVSNKNIILIGFKHVGKSLIGRHLATRLNKQFIDLDKSIETRYAETYGEACSCHQIVQTQGEAIFRALESATLEGVIHSENCVIALGGGTAFSACNQAMIQDHLLLHVDAPRGIVFERIMVNGRPAFFDLNKDPYESFNDLWNDRHKIYKKLTKHTINNSHTVEQAVNQALIYVSQHESCI